MGHARALLGIETATTQLELYQDIIAEGLSVRDVEEIVKNIALAKEELPEKENNKTQNRPDQKEFEQIQKDLAYLYDCKVQVKTRINGKGSIVLQFGSNEELDNILSLLKK